VEGETETEGEKEGGALGLGLVLVVEEVVGVGRWGVAEGSALGLLVPSTCTAPARGALPDTLSQSAPNWQAPEQVGEVCAGSPQ
jgi:hypothetical protein